MGNILTDVHQRYLLNFGKYALSPLSAVSAGLMLEYIDNFQKAEFSRTPFIVNFPNKKEACIPICSALLVNFFLRDYVYQNMETTSRSDLKKGHIIEIFNTVAQIKHIGDEEMKLFFAQELEYSLPKAHFKYIIKSKKNKLSNYSLFKENKKALFANRNAISQILEPNATDLVNPSVFSSSVLLVAGRGNLGRIREGFEGSRLYGEALSKILLEGTSLILRKDLEEYKNIFCKDIEGTIQRYKSLFAALFERLMGNLLVDLNLLQQLNEKIVNDEFLNRDYVDLYNDLLESVDEAEDAYKLLFNLKEKYPGVKEQVSPNLKAVIINDIYILELYKETVNGLLLAGIPVICLCDRLFESRDSLEFYTNWFAKNQEYMRINWNKSKIQYLAGIHEVEKVLIDAAFWKQSVSYATQKINFEIFDDGGIEKPINALINKISTTDGHELLKEAFWKYLFPITYLLKNTPGDCKPLYQLITLFEAGVSNHVVDEVLHQEIQQVIELLKATRSNRKKAHHGATVFEQTLASVGNTRYFIPFSDNKAKASKTPDVLPNQITFTGFPYQEWHYRYLIKAICEDCIPEVNVLAWPEEYSLTYRYIRQRMAASYFTDNFKSTYSFPKELVLTKKADFEIELDAYMHCDDHQVPEQVGLEPHTFFEHNFNIRHQRFLVSSGGPEDDFAVRCNIIYFENQEFLYLPHHSKMLAELFAGVSEKRFGRCDFDNLYEGCMLFQYCVSRSDLRNLAKSLDSVFKAFQILELWKELLQSLYKSCGSNISVLEKTLVDVKRTRQLNGNPTRQNIQRWLFQEDIISPDVENLEIILRAASSVDVDGMVKKNMEASKIIKGFMISIASQIQKEIIRYINAQDNELIGMECLIYNKPVRIEARKIIALERTDVLIKYADTRKVLK